MSDPYHWEVFEAGKVKHIAPCAEDGSVACGHLLTAFCPCGPTPDSADPLLIVHHEGNVLTYQRHN